MLEGHDIVCFSKDWDDNPFSKKHIMTRLAKKNRVLWVSKALPPAGNGIAVCTPPTLPFCGSVVGRFLNRESVRWSVRRMCKKLGFRNPITWTFDPASADVVGSFNESAIVYHCVDDYTELTGSDKTAFLEMEKRLIRKSNYVVVSSGLMKANKQVHNPNTFLVTPGVDVDHFRKACRPDTLVPDEMKTFHRTIIGFFGVIADWIDLDLIRFIADSKPEWDLVLIGNVVTDIRIFDGARNIHMLGRKPYQLLPNYAKAFDVAIVPFSVNELTLAANPLKMREYLAAGLPVVSTPLSEAERMKHAVHIGRHKLDFLHQLESVVESGMTGPQMKISQRMDCESWDEKVEQLSRIIFQSQTTKATA